ncbi:amidase [Nonomuraea sp. NPDC046802]|uniref:amidase n=1 Tax=Nonomuraea sp. NPDC046802 TaxID=3154919 RepID=UPI00340C0A8F
MTSEFAFLDATAQADLVRRKEVSPLELVEAAIERIERVDPQVNSVVIHAFEQARQLAASPELADGPFRGVPITVKDLLAVAGVERYCGFPFLKELRWRETFDCHTVARLKSAGFVVVGKANCPDAGVTTETETYGDCRNPWHLDHSVGGSSGGSAASVAAGLVPVSLGTDGGGSIRIPASECGVVGLKGSRGRVSHGPHWGDPHGGGFLNNHVLTRTVRDSAAIMDIEAGWMPGDPYAAPPLPRPLAQEVGADPGQLRIGLWLGEGHPLGVAHPDCVLAAETTAELLDSLGHRVYRSWPKSVEVGLPPRVAAMQAAGFLGQISYWSTRIGRQVEPCDFEPFMQSMVEQGHRVTGEDYAKFFIERDEISYEIHRWWTDGWDVLLTPTIGLPPPKLGVLSATRGEQKAAVETMVEIVRFTAQFNYTGQPAISLPMHWNAEELPVGVQLVAAYGREDLLIRVASQLEEAKSWADRRPRVHA